MGIVITGIIAALVVVVVQYLTVAKKMSSSRKFIENMEKELNFMKETHEKVQTLFDQMIDVGSLREKAQEMRAVQESLKAERGRVTITQAELETVESRLRELEEIERELDASGVEAKEELNILKAKEEELNKKNEKLKLQFADATAELDKMMGTIEQNAQLEELVHSAKQNMLQTQSQIETMIMQIEEGNDQYCSLKKRYDALDIEYAQLFEKFSEGGGG